MARAEMASPSIAKRFGFGAPGQTTGPGLTGHARLLAHPAYQKLLTAEPLLRRLIPILILVFLTIVGAVRFVDLYQLRGEREAEARNTISLIASVVSTALTREGSATNMSGAEIQNALADALPLQATQRGRRIFVTRPDGTIAAGAPFMPAPGTLLTDIVGEAQPLTTFGARAGILQVALADGEAALGAVHHLSDPLGSVAVIQPMGQITAGWRSEVSLNVVIFIATSSILLVILYGYFSQSARAIEADRIYTETQVRFETALTRGRCGLWDWDLGQARIFWSRSMFDMVGLPSHDTVLGFGEVNRLIHPDDGDLMELVETLYNSGKTTIDRVFRIRHADGRWIWLRARAELVDRDTPTPHLIGIAVDVTEQMQLVERSKTADIRLLDAIETISEAFVLWDSDNRLVMCNSKYQQLHGIPDDILKPGMPYNDVVALGRKPIVRSQITGGEAPEDGARSFELQLDDGSWLQINERRTKDGGFVSVGTDISQLKRHEGKLIDGERRLMATITDLRQSRQKLEHQAQMMVNLAENLGEEKNRAEEANRTKSEFLANISHELRTPLNAVIGFSEIMQSGMFGDLGSPKYLEYSRDIHSSGTYLLGVINDILDMSRIEAGRMMLEYEDLLLNDLMRESIRIVRTQAAAQNIKITFTGKENLRMLGDRRAIKQIILNLLSNAVKFTPEGGQIRVRARIVADAMIFTVADSGIGIPKDAIAKLGRPFEQVSNQFTKSHRGSGLGLAITGSLARLHGGAMRIRSREKNGTTVSVRLPSGLPLPDAIPGSEPSVAPEVPASA
jgi:two-component system cell cycle sensor histidine kinase PleC